MVKITPFEVEQWMDRYETTPGVINIAETCCASISITDLISLRDTSSPDYSLQHPLQLSKKLTYGDILGSETLRSRVASLLNRDLNLYSSEENPLTAENIVITQGAIAANFLVFYTLVGLGDHVISVYPTYQQLYSVPESLGAEVSLWKLKAENGYLPDVEELKGLVRENTKLLVLNNPNNPTGATIPTTTLQSIIDFCSSRNITILSDEVYSPLFHSLSTKPSPAPPSILSISPSSSSGTQEDKKTCTTISTGSMSKAFALAGLRLGWIASRSSSFLRAIASARDYTAISVSQLDDQVASYALGPTVLPALLERNINLARANLELLTEFVEGKYSKVCSWVRPTAGTTALVQLRNMREGGVPVDDAALVLDVLEKTKVLFMPGSPCFGLGTDFKGSVRIGYACETQVLEKGLKLLGQYVEEHFL